VEEAPLLMVTDPVGAVVSPLLSANTFVCNMVKMEKTAVIKNKTFFI
jgi:hypothetical protein